MSVRISPGVSYNHLYISRLIKLHLNYYHYDYAWDFYMRTGHQIYSNQLINVYGLAVRSGQVSAADPVPSYHAAFWHRNRRFGRV